MSSESITELDVHPHTDTPPTTEKNEISIQDLGNRRNLGDTYHRITTNMKDIYQNYHDYNVNKKVSHVKFYTSSVFSCDSSFNPASLALRLLPCFLPSSADSSVSLSMLLIFQTLNSLSEHPVINLVSSLATVNPQTLKSNKYYYYYYHYNLLVNPLSPRSDQCRTILNSLYKGVREYPQGS